MFQPGVSCVIFRTGCTSQQWQWHHLPCVCTLVLLVVVRMWNEEIISHLKTLDKLYSFYHLGVGLFVVWTAVWLRVDTTLVSDRLGRVGSVQGRKIKRRSAMPKQSDVLCVLSWLANVRHWQADTQQSSGWFTFTHFSSLGNKLCGVQVRSGSSVFRFLQPLHHQSSRQHA